MIYNESLPLATLTCRNELDMVLIYKKKLVQFWGRRTDSKKHLENWCRKIENNYFCTSSQLRDEFPKIRLIGGGQAVFNVKNNRYRLIVKFYFENGVVQVRTHPTPITTEEEYESTMARLIKTLNSESGDSSRSELPDLIERVKAYEDEHYPIEFPDALSAIEFHMDQTGLSLKDIAPCFGSINKARDVLAGRRELTLSMKRSLHEMFQIPADVLLGEPNKDFHPDVNQDEIKRFPWNEIRRKGWVTPWNDWKDRKEEMYIELARLEQGIPAPSSVLLRKSGKYRGKSDANHHAVQAWCMRVANIASDNPTTGAYVSGSITHELMRKVAALSVHDNGPLLARKRLSEYGVNLVIERHLKKTCLDGAAFRLSDGQPVIGLTLRFDRLDYFWFTLMHELAHLSLHLDDNPDELFVDELDFSDAGSNSLESEADKCANESLIPSELWESSDAQFSSHPSDVYQLANSANIHAAIVVGRVRFENNNYTNLSGLVGQGEVRKHFEVQPR